MILRMLALVSVLPTDVGRNVHIDHAGERTDAWLRRVWVGGGARRKRETESRAGSVQADSRKEKTADDPTNQPQRTHATTNRGITVLGQRAVLHQSHCSVTRSRIATFKKEEWVSLEWRHNYQKTTFLDSALVG